MITTTPEFWVFVAFVILLLGLGKRAYVNLTQTLDTHRNSVSKRLEDAQRLHDEALSLLNSYKTKHKEASLQADKILAFSEAEIEEFKTSAKKDFKRFMTQKEKSLLERLEIEKQEAKSKLVKETVEAAINLVEQTLSEKSEEKKKLTQASLKKISSLPEATFRSSKI